MNEPSINEAADTTYDYNFLGLSISDSVREIWKSRAITWQRARMRARCIVPVPYCTVYDRSEIFARHGLPYVLRSIDIL